MMLAVEKRLRKRIRGSSIWTSTTGANPTIQFWRVADDQIFGPIYSWSTTNATTACGGVCTDGRNVFVLHSNAATYQFDVYRPTGEFLYSSGTFAGNNYAAAKDIDWDGRNIICFYHTTISELVRNMRAGKHRPDGTLLFDQLIGRNQNSWNGGCWTGNEYWSTYTTAIAGDSRKFLRLRWDPDTSTPISINFFAASGTGNKVSLAYNGKDIWTIRNTNLLSMVRTAADIENPLAYAFGATQGALSFA